MHAGKRTEPGCANSEGGQTVPCSAHAGDLQSVPDSMDIKGIIQIVPNPVYEGIPEPVYEEPMQAGLLLH